MPNNEATIKLLRTLQIIQVFLILAILSYWDVANRSAKAIQVSLNDTTTHVLIILLLVFGIYTSIVGFIGPEMLLKRSKRVKDEKLVTLLLFARAGLFEAVAIYGFLLRIIGASWLLVLPFFFAAAAMLLLTFPTKTVWNKMISLASPPG